MKVKLTKKGIASFISGDNWRLQLIVRNDFDAAPNFDRWLKVNIRTTTNMKIKDKLMNTFA